MTVAIAVAFLAPAALVSTSIAPRLTVSATGSDQSPQADGSVPLACTCLAVGFAMVGAAMLSSGDLAITGVGPFIVAALAVGVPLAVARRRALREEPEHAAG